MIEGIPCLRLLPPLQAGLAPGDAASNKPLGANKTVGVGAREAAGEATQSTEVALQPEHPERCQRHAGSRGDAEGRRAQVCGHRRPHPGQFVLRPPPNPEHRGAWALP